MAVKISTSLIERLGELGQRFCLVRGKSPAIGGRDWQKPENLMRAFNEKLQRHIYRGGNYGVVGGLGLVIVDIDLQELKQIVERRLPSTFTVESPGSHGWHLYYRSDMEKPIRLRDEEGENIGDIQGRGKMVVGPGSIHPNGGVYKVIKDLPLARVTRNEIKEAFKEYVVPDPEINRVEWNARREHRFKIDLGILQVIPLAGLQKRGKEYFGSHPTHGSDTGQNFWVNPSKNCWHCFRHQSGGGPLLWLAVETGIIRCAEAGPGVLCGKVFKKVLKAGRKRGLIPESDAPFFSRSPVEELELRKYGDKVVYNG